MLIIPDGIENYQKIMLNEKNEGSSRYSQPLLTYSRKSNMAAVRAEWSSIPESNKD